MNRGELRGAWTGIAGLGFEELAGGWAGATAIFGLGNDVDLLRAHAISARCRALAEGTDDEFTIFWDDAGNVLVAATLDGEQGQIRWAGGSAVLRLANDNGAAGLLATTAGSIALGPLGVADLAVDWGGAWGQVGAWATGDEGGVSWARTATVLGFADDDIHLRLESGVTIDVAAGDGAAGPLALLNLAIDGARLLVAVFNLLVDFRAFAPVAGLLLDNNRCAPAMTTTAAFGAR